MNQEPAWAFAQRRLIWGGWGGLMLGVSLLFGLYLFSVRDQVREAAWAEGKAATRMLRWQLQAQMQHLDDVLLHTCESFERLGTGLTEKDALFKGRASVATPYEHMFILGPRGESMLSLPLSVGAAWEVETWVHQARLHGMGQIFTMVQSRGDRVHMARVLPVWSESGEFKGAVVGILSASGLESLVRETAQPYGLDLSVVHNAVAVVRSSEYGVELENVDIFREQVRLPELDLVLDVALRHDAVMARWSMSWQWLLMVWALIVFALTWGAAWLNRALTRQVQSAASVKAEQEAARVRAGFLANMSHELRTPMMGVLGAAELLEGSSGPEQARYIKMISDSGRHLLNLLNNVLDFSRLDAGAFPLDQQEVQPLMLLQEVLQSFSPQSELRNVTLYGEFDLPSELKVRLDGFRFSQIISNLMGNAFKFTQQGWVRVQAGLEQTDQGSKLWVRITDTGIGISPEQQLRLFKPFSQADESTSRRYGGSGLGLVIVQQLLNLMAGEIRLKSTEGLGTEVWLSVPVEVTHTGQKKSSSNGFWHVDVGDDLLRSLTLCHLKHLGVSVCSEPLSAGLNPSVRLVDAKTWSDLCKSGEPSFGGPWVVLQLTEADLDMNHHAYRSVLKISAWQSREAWAELVDRCQVAEPVMAITTEQDEESVTRILVAEDNETTRKILAIYFSTTQYLIDFAPDGEIALDLWGQRRYAMAILDCHMPRLDGFAVAERIRADEHPNRRMPLVALTAATMHEDVVRCKQAGIDEVWSKPISKAQLLENVKRWL